MHPQTLELTGHKLAVLKAYRIGMFDIVETRLQRIGGERLSHRAIGKNRTR